MQDFSQLFGLMNMMNGGGGGNPLAGLMGNSGGGDNPMLSQLLGSMGGMNMPNNNTETAQPSGGMDMQNMMKMFQMMNGFNANTDNVIESSFDDDYSPEIVEKGHLNYKVYNILGNKEEDK